MKTGIHKKKMLFYKWCTCTLFVALLKISVTYQQIISETIVVDQSGQRCNFTTIQAAVNSIPSNNQRWIRIDIKPGVYREQVLIPRDKPFIFLRGSGMRNTQIVWNGHDDIVAGATFASEANNTLARDISFINSYNARYLSPLERAVAARIHGDKSVFYRCQFYSVQDTLWDAEGRHYFRLCSIRGAVDFIFGAGQSLYENCIISVADLNGITGFITAQGRGVPSETSGFVFKHCSITGRGRAFLGRPWRDYARVLFYNTSMSEAVVPQGWGIWDRWQQVNQLTLSEYNSRGPGANNAERVTWAKKMSEEEAGQLANISFIDNEGWLNTAFTVFAA